MGGHESLRDAVQLVCVRACVCVRLCYLHVPAHGIRRGFRVWRLIFCVVSRSGGEFYKVKRERRTPKQYAFGRRAQTGGKEGRVRRPLTPVGRWIFLLRAALAAHPVGGHGHGGR